MLRVFGVRNWEAHHIEMVLPKGPNTMIKHMYQYSCNISCIGAEIEFPTSFEMESKYIN